MRKSKSKLINFLRWVSIIPIVIIAYIAFKIVYAYLANIMVSEYFRLLFYSFSSNKNNTYDYINEINRAQGFAGHYIIGSIYIFTKELLAVTIAIFSGVYIAPTHKKQVGYSLIILLIISSIILFVFALRTREYFIYTTEVIIRIILEYMGMLVGGYFLWKILPEYDKDLTK